MIPVSFDYMKPSTVEDAVNALADASDEGKVLAGGQSLLPVLRLRLAAPALLVDLGGLPQLRGIRSDGDTVAIGAMTTHAELAAAGIPLLSQAAATVGDRQVRHLGTIGGSLAHADPAGDLPTAAVALDAQMVIANQDGRRIVPASEFFVDIFTTALRPGELLVEVRVPRLDGWGTHYAKVNRTAQAWATVAVAAAVRRSNGGIAEARVALTNMGRTPVRARATEEALAGSASVAEAAALASEGDGYKNHLARVLTRRAVLAAVGN
jgi:carbon-monoxide dehydrogenase medium subunit